MPTPLPPSQIFMGQHAPMTSVRVNYSRDPQTASLGLDILVGGKEVTRVYSPQEVTTWFAQNSKKLLPLWQEAYHKSGLTPTSYRAPAPPPSLDRILAVPYHSQRDNRDRPLGSCNVTSYAMALLFKGAKRKFSEVQFPQFEDELAHFLEINHRDRHNHEDLAWMGREYGFDCRFGQDRTMEQIRAQIRAGNPVVVSGIFTSAGHIIVLRGTQGEDFRVNDPYGNVFSKSLFKRKYANANGENLLYPRDYLMRMIKSPGQNAKWAHFFGDAL